jgi:antibiotic biosynthesis monooxygenase (ABM) superfamily enzyme
MGFPEYIFVVAATVDPAVEEEWNDWYNNVHLPEITACPGFRRSARYVHEEGDVRNYLTIYEISGKEALEGVQFSTRRGWGRFTSQVKATVRVYRRLSLREGSDAQRKR